VLEVPLGVYSINCHAKNFILRTSVAQNPVTSDRVSIAD